MSKQKILLKKIITDLVLLCAIILIAETACRVLPIDVPAPDDTNRFYYLNILPHKPLFKKITHGTHGKFTSVHPFVKRIEFPAKKYPGTKRIFILGDSFAQEITLFLQKQLSDLYPQYRFEIINCSISGYDSHNLNIVSSQIFNNYDPDAVILFADNNEGTRPANNWFRRFQCIATRRSALLRFIEKYKPPAKGKKHIAHPRIRSENCFALNLRSIVYKAQAAKVPLLLCTTPFNLHYPPSGKWPETELFEKGRISLLMNSPEIAEEFLTESLKNNPTHPHTLFALGQTFIKLKKYKKALHMLEKAGNVDFPSGRVCPQLNSILKQTAKNNPQCILVDTNQTIKMQHLKDPVPAGLFYDNCHVWPAIFEIISKKIVSAMARQKVLGNAFVKETTLRYTTPDPIPETSITAWLLQGYVEFANCTDFLNEKTLYYFFLLSRYRPALLEKLKNATSILKLIKQHSWAASKTQADIETIQKHMYGLSVHAGFALLKNGKTAQAKSFFKHAATLKPRDKYAHIGLHFCKSPEIPSE